AYEFSAITFPTHGASLFRATLRSVEEGVQVWVECKKTKQQWQATVTSVADCGPAGVPEEAIIQFLKVISSGSKVGSDDPVVDFLAEGGEHSLVLTLSVNGVWKPEFVFPMLPVGLDKMDILEAKLRDAQEEIVQLREKTPDFLTLTSRTACGHQQIVVWEQLTSREIPPVFCLSEDKRQVTIMKAGVYQIHVRLAERSNANGAHLGLQLNGDDIAQCTQSDGSGHQNTPQITEILELAEGACLQVRCGANSSSLGIVNANRFSILLLGE
ncbi:unnamed protein product, partial [Ectocarpus fasciculatus]